MFCLCKEESRILTAEVDFLKDQRGPRKLKLSLNVDSNLSSQYLAKQQRIRANALSPASSLSTLSLQSSSTSSLLTSSSSCLSIALEEPEKRPRPSYQLITGSETEDEGADAQDSVDMDFIFKGRPLQKRFCNPITAKATRDADRKFVSSRGQAAGIANTCDAIEEAAENRGLTEVQVACAASTVKSHTTVLRNKEKHRTAAVEELVEILQFE